jgi:hypothetical protein
MNTCIIHNEFRDYNKMGNEMNGEDGGYATVVMEMMINPPRIFVVLKILLSGRMPGRASGPSRSRVDDGCGSRCVSGKVIKSLGFSRRGVFIGEGAALEVDQGAHTTRGGGQP